MFSLGDEISKITNPNPDIFDPEDEDNILTTGKWDSTLEIEAEDAGLTSDLRKRTAPLLEDIDSTYAGRKVSRSTLKNLFQECEDDGLGKKDAETVSDETFSDSSESQYLDSLDDDLSESDVNNFKTLVKSQSVKRLSDEEVEQGNEDEISSESDIENAQDLTQQFSNIDVTSEIERGEAVKSQKEIWNRLLETRIKLQKLLITSNKLPQSNIWQQVKKKGSNDMAEHLEKGTQSMKTLLNHLLEFQCELTNRTLELNGSIVHKIESNEEICSDTEEEMEKLVTPNEAAGRGVKRKASDDYNKILNEQFKSLIPYRNSVITKWDEKTRLATGRMTQKAFAGFDNSALKQIEQILQDKTRLIRRTQLKRSLYRVLGKPEVPEFKNDGGSKEVSVSKQDMLLKDNDPEVFDDDDFYRQILKDVIESKSFGMDPSVVRKQMEIQKIRNKMKRKVDTKASKGRKLRYDIHPKLINFMAPVEINQIADEARESFSKYVFGRKNVTCS